MMKLTQALRAVFGVCPVCQAEPGVVCTVIDGGGPMDFGAHRRRIQLAPLEVPAGEEEVEVAEMDVGDSAMPNYYLAALDRVKASGPDWPASVRMDLIMATAMLMQAEFNAGFQYGAPGFPNMQTLLEIGGMPADELESLRGMTVMQIDTILIPFFRDGQLPLPAPQHAGVVDLVENAGRAASEILQGIREAQAAGRATDDEAALADLFDDILESGKNLILGMGAQLVPLVMALDEKRWPGVSEVKAAITEGMNFIGMVEGGVGGSNHSSAGNDGTAATATKPEAPDSAGKDRNVANAAADAGAGDSRQGTAGSEGAGVKPGQ